MANDTKKLSPEPPVLPTRVEAGSMESATTITNLIRRLNDAFAELHVVMTKPQFEEVTSEGDIENTVGGPRWIVGSADPTGGLAAPIGSLYSRTSGGASTTLYVKTGAGDTAWTAK